MGFSALSVIKFGVSGVVGLGAGKVVNKIIKNNIGEVEGLIDKVSVVAATWAMGGMASAAAKKFTSDSIDSTYHGAVKQINQFKLDAKLGRISNGKSTFEAEGLDKSNFILDVKSGNWKQRKIEDEGPETIGKFGRPPVS